MTFRVKNGSVDLPSSAKVQRRESHESTRFLIRKDLERAKSSPKAPSAVIQSWQEFQTRCACSSSRKTNKKIRNPQTFSFYSVAGNGFDPRH